jgi:DNA-binding transcriptional regulator YiaG
MKNKKSIKTGSQVNNDITIDFGNRLKKTRGHLHLSQKDFAARLDIAGSYLSEIEAGKTRLSGMMKKGTLIRFVFLSRPGPARFEKGAFRFEIQYY